MKRIITVIIMLTLALTILTGCAVTDENKDVATGNASNKSTTAKYGGCATAEEAIAAYFRAYETRDVEVYISVTTLSDELAVYRTEENLAKAKKAIGDDPYFSEMYQKDNYDKLIEQTKSYIVATFNERELVVDGQVVLSADQSKEHMRAHTEIARSYTINFWKDYNTEDTEKISAASPYPISNYRVAAIRSDAVSNTDIRLNCVRIEGKWYINII